MTRATSLREHHVHSGQPGFRDAWNEVLSGEFSGKKFEPRDPGGFLASIRCVSTEDGLLLAHARSSAARIGHEQDHVTGQTQREFILHYQISGSSLNVQAGREALLRPGDFTFCDTGRPYSIEFEQPTDVLVLRLRQDRLLDQLGGLDDLVAIPVCRKAPGAALFSNFIETFWGDATAGNWQDVDHSLEDAMLSLLQLAYRPVIADRLGDRAVHVKRWTEAMRFVDENLANAELNLAVLCDHMHVSSRYLQSLFAQRGETFTSYVRAQRLERASRLLANAGFGQEGIINIAMDCGFNDLSYFTREFRRRFGMPPARYRAARLSQ